MGNTCKAKQTALVLLMGLQLFAAPVFAVTKYVSDVLYITLRSGQGDEYRILRSLKSGVKLEIIQELDGEYALVRTEDGLEGYVQHRFLADSPVAADLLTKAQDDLNTVTKENEQLKTKLASVREELKDTEKERKRLESENQQMSNKQEKLEKVAAKPIQLDEENRELRTRNAELQKELAEVKQDNLSMKDSAGRDWFLTGAGVVLLGVLIGLVLPRLHMRRKSSWA